MNRSSVTFKSSGRACFAALLVLCFSGGNALGQGPVLSKELYSVDVLLKEFRGTFETKIDQLTKNFRQGHSDFGVSLSSDKSTKCRTVVVPDFQTVSEIRFQARPTSQGFFEEVQYLGCGFDTPSFREVIESRGKNLAPAGWDDVLHGRRVLIGDSDAGLTFRNYQIFDQLDRQLIGVTIQRRVLKDRTETQSDFYIETQRVLTILETHSSTVAKAVYITNRFNHSYEAQTGGSKRTSFTDDVTITIVSGSSGQISYLVSGGEYETDLSTIAFVDFQKLITHRVLNGSLSQMGFILKDFMNLLPPTESIRLGSRSGRFQDELQQVLSYLEGNNVAQARGLLQGLLAAIQANDIEIKDKRQ